MDRRRRNVRLAGACALLSAVTSAAALGREGAGQIGGAFTGGQPTVYGAAQAALVVVLAGGGVLLLVVRHRATLTGLLVVVGLCSAQLAGAGTVAFRRWPLYWGCCSPELVTDQNLVRLLAVVMTLVCTVTAVVSIVTVVAERHLRWAGVGPTVVAACAAGVVVAVGGPLLVVGGYGDVRGLAAWALMYSLPLGAALASSALLPRAAALVTAGTVAASAFVSTAGWSYFELNQPWGGARPLVVVAAAVVAATRLGSREPRPQADVTSSASTMR